MGAPIKDVITYDDFDKLDIRAGRIVRVEDVPKSKKLVALTVDFGDFERTIVSAMYEDRDDPHALEGLQGLFVVNLAPRKMAGIMSEGMVLEVGYEDGVHPLPLVVPEFEVPNGARLS